MVGYDDDNNALTLGDDDILRVGDYELKYSGEDDEWRVDYGVPIGGESGLHGEIFNAQYSTDSNQVGEYVLSIPGKGGVNIPDIPTIGGSSSFSISTWVRVIDDGRTFDYEKLGMFQNGNIQLKIDDSDTENFNLTIQYTEETFDEINMRNWTGDVWYLYTVTVDPNGDMIGYINGVQEASTAVTGTIFDEDNPQNSIAYDRSDGDDHAPIDVDDFRIYDRALSALEVTDLYNGVDVTSGLVARYNFESPETPNVAIDSTGDVYPQNSVPRSTSGSLVPKGLAESVSAGEALADDGNTYSSVQDAVNAASGWVFVGPGTFNEAVTIDKPGLTVQGSGYNTLVDGGTSGDAIGVSVSNVTIKNISAQTPAGNGADHNAISFNAGATDGIVHNVTVRESDRHGINMIDSSPVVSNCVVNNVDSVGILSEGSGSIISNNTITSSDGITVNVTDDSVVSNNVIVEPGTTGIYIRDSDDNIVIGNRIINSSDEGIRLAINSPTDNIVANNRISDSTNESFNDNGAGTLFDGNLTGPSN